MTHQMNRETKKAIKRANEIRKKYLENPDNFKTYTLDEIIDKYVGLKGTPKRDEFEEELKADLALQNINNKFDNKVWCW